ncbi:unnamed protein product [Amoebophrya sp. A25]|nr:unnamed protein product [Amoebophrya sp. A25]|eukprot:GSA25T00009274001.1
MMTGKAEESAAAGSNEEGGGGGNSFADCGVITLISLVSVLVLALTVGVIIAIVHFTPAAAAGGSGDVTEFEDEVQGESPAESSNANNTSLLDALESPVGKEGEEDKDEGGAPPNMEVFAFDEPAKKEDEEVPARDASGRFLDLADDKSQGKPSTASAAGLPEKDASAKKMSQDSIPDRPKTGILQFQDTPANPGAENPAPAEEDQAAGGAPAQFYNDALADDSGEDFTFSKQDSYDAKRRPLVAASKQVREARKRAKPSPTDG